MSLCLRNVKTCSAADTWFQFYNDKIDLFKFLQDKKVVKPVEKEIVKTKKKSKKVRYSFVSLWWCIFGIVSVIIISMF